MSRRNIVFLLSFLVALDTSVVLAHIFFGERIHFFDLDREGNLASLVAGVKLWVLAASTFAVAFLFHFLRRAEKIRIHRLKPIIWGIAGSGFFWIGLDDMMGIHERFGFVLNNALHTGGFYGESFNWLMYYSPAIVFALAVFVFVLRDLWQDARSSALIGAGGLFLWISSLGSELFGRHLLLQAYIDVPFYHRVSFFEEAFEMLGADLLLLAIATCVIVHVRRYVVLR